jgi:polysaccharide deacetylase family protein (PEP-CTERM system associated)
MSTFVESTGCPATCAGLEPAAPAAPRGAAIFSFDVEEHYLIEAAAGLTVPAELKEHYRQRLDVSTRWLLEALAAGGVRGTFFIVGLAAHHNPALVRNIHAAGHEVACHSWAHSPLHLLGPAAFRADVRGSKALLEDLTGEAVVGFRAPTFSMARRTAWAIDILAEEGFRYDSSIFPIYHDRYGIPEAPRTPFLVGGVGRRLLELPPLTYRLLGLNVPVGGGGYFRLLPKFLIHKAIKQVGKLAAGPAMLYFHPWEFDPEQVRLPMGRLSRWRTYFGLGRTRARLARLLEGIPCTRAADAAAELAHRPDTLEFFSLLA